MLKSNVVERLNYVAEFEKKDKLDSFITPQVYYYHNDQLGTPNELTNEKGEVVWLNYSMAWGESSKVIYNANKLGIAVIDDVTISAEMLQPIRFQGQFFDEETGLHYNRFRYYDADCGMFVSRDPIGLMGGNNTFQYAPNPTGWIDPLGLSNKCNTQPRDSKGKFKSPKNGDSQPGKNFEKSIEERLRKNPNVEVLGTQVTVRTEKGDRYMDILFKRKKDDKLFHVEVKGNTATRTRLQKEKDALIDQGVSL